MKKFRFLTIVFFTFYLNGFCFYENIFESKPYVVIFKLSNQYSNYKVLIEKAIDSKKINKINKKDFDSMENLLLKTLDSLNSIYQKYNGNHTIKSQIYQIRFEVEESIKLIKEIKKTNKKNKEYEKKIFKLESLFYRIEVYLKGISQNLSNL